MQSEAIKVIQSIKIHYQMETKSLFLRPYCKKYVPQYNTWFEKDKDLLYLTGSQPLTLQQQIKNHESWIIDPKKYTFLILLKQSNIMIGDVNLFFSDWIQPHQAQINIMIAVKDFRGKGYAQQILQVIQDFAFGVYQKNEIIAKIKDDNNTSIKFFEKRGYIFINHNKGFGEVQYRKVLKKDKQQVLQKLKNNNKLLQFSGQLF